MSPRPIVRRAVVIAAAVAIALGVAAPAASAVESPKSNDPTGEALAPKGSAGSSCDTYVTRNPTTGDATVVADSCSSDPVLRDAAKNEMEKQRNYALPRIPVLVELWSLPDYKGAVRHIYGKDGPCDALGYSLRSLSKVNNGMSGIRSYIAENGCTAQRIYTNPSFQGNRKPMFGTHHNWVGGWHDGAVRSMKLWRHY